MDCLNTPLEEYSPSTNKYKVFGNSNPNRWGENNYKKLNTAFWVWQQYAVTEGPCANGDNTMDVCIATTFGPVPMPDDNFEVSWSDSEWIAITQLIMDEGIHTEDYDLPPLAELRDAFVGFEREEDFDIEHVKSYVWFLHHSMF